MQGAPYIRNTDSEQKPLSDENSSVYVSCSTLVLSLWKLWANEALLTSINDI